MQQYIKNYLEHHNLDEGDNIVCQWCGCQPAIDVHHIEPRSKFGKKTRHIRDDPSNLIALCRECHNDAHDNKMTKDKLREISAL